MGWVLLEIIVPLLIAVLIGLLLGWLLWRWRRDRVTYSEWETSSTAVAGGGSGATVGAVDHDATIDLRTRLDATEADLVASRARIAELESERDRTAELESEHDRTAELESELGASRERADQLEQELESARDHLGQLQAELDARPTDAQGVVASAQDPEPGIAPQHLADLELNASVARARADQLDVELNAASTRIAELETDLGAAASRIGDLEMERTEAATQAAENERRLEAAAATVAELEARADVERTRTTDLEADLAATTARVAELEAAALDTDLSAATARITELEAELAAVAARSSQLRGELSTAAARTTDLETDLHAAQTRSRRVEGELAAAMRRITEMERAGDDVEIDLRSTDAPVPAAPTVAGASSTQQRIVNAAVSAGIVGAAGAATPTTGQELADGAELHPFGPGSHGPLADRRAQPDGYPIKGNLGSMLYHRPDSRSYGATIAEVWFATSDAAETAGFTKSRTHPKD